MWGRPPSAVRRAKRGRVVGVPRCDINAFGSYA